MKRASFLPLVLTLALSISTSAFGQQYWNGGQQVDRTAQNALFD